MHLNHGPVLNFKVCHQVCETINTLMTSENELKETIQQMNTRMLFIVFEVFEYFILI